MIHSPPFMMISNIEKENVLMAKETDTTKYAAGIAQFRFALIAPVIQGLYPDASAKAYYKRVTENPLTLPDGSTVKYNYKTLEKWKSLYNSGGLDALMPSQRADKGISRTLNDEAITEIYRIKQEHPRMNATQIHDHLVRESFIPATVSVDSVQRFIRHNNLKSARDPNLRDRKAFEEDKFGKIWQADTCYFPYITEDGRSRRVYCIMIIDDHSRMLVGGELFYNDNAGNFQKERPQRGEIRGSLRHHGQDEIIHQIAQSGGAGNGGIGCDKDAQHHHDQSGGVGLHVTQKPQEGLFGIFGFAAVTAHFCRRH